ncbi:hypothetical protein DB30_07315 [Enhygromyxa salina]|uniref:Uncharacterized protein n=1 Tax=Enhygromyxa salina TaxID=215803 RepID=A0A0C1ZSK5_9BACT|nr:hypothetical protein [Enhygromyxa salina]KIG14048.1 hypothetical protein DB30_07315 [Enhygromyxa salina]
MSDTYIHEFPGIQRQFLFVPPEDASEIDIAEAATEGIFALAQGLFEPVALELELAVCERETFVVRKHQGLSGRWLLVRERLPANVDTVDNPARFVTVTCEALTASATNEFVAAAVAQQVDEPGLMVTWQTMTLLTSCAKLPLDIVGETIAVTHGAGTVTHPVERRNGEGWVYGPLGTSTLVAPIDLMVLNDLGELTLTMSIHWSLWSQPSARGHAQVVHSVERLLARGWTEEH